jgi:hypothetical protein
MNMGLFPAKLPLAAAITLSWHDVGLTPIVKQSL